MSTTDSELFKTAIKLAQEATVFDNDKRYEEAYAKYVAAADALMEFKRFNRNPKLIQLADQRAKQYVERAKILHDTINKKQKVKAGGPQSKSGDSKSPKNAGSGENKGDGDSSEESSDEEKELRAAIEGSIVTEKPTITWADVAGMEDAKQALREAVVLPMAHPELFKGARKPWRGILLFGPPGCGKTLLAKAAANECNTTFFAADSATLMSKWLGESEKLLKTLFKVANLDAPSLIFFDEIDSIATKRGQGNEGGGERRLKTQLLQEMQGMKTNVDKLVTVMGATNMPWEIDSALLRRFEKKIYIGLPDFLSREKIFELGVKGVDKEDDVNFKTLAEMTEGYSGSDISTVCREVVMLPIRELDKNGKLVIGDKIEVRKINMDDFKTTLKSVRPVSSKEDIQKFLDWQEEFGG
jgi:vacuolar protein-sorting-associated protein 4